MKKQKISSVGFLTSGFRPCGSVSILGCLLLLAVVMAPIQADAGWAWPWEAGRLQVQAQQDHFARIDSDSRAKLAARDRNVAQKRARHLNQLLIVVGLAGTGAIVYFIKTRKVIQQVVKNEVVEQIVKKEIVHKVEVVRSPAHDLVADAVLIDGTNVLYASPNPTPSLLHLLGLLLQLQKSGTKFECIFDASTVYKLKELAGQKHSDGFNRLCQEYPDIFYTVPAGNQADDYLLDDAHRTGQPIISNDRFLEFADKYEWLKSDSKRRVSFSIHGGIIQVVPMGIHAAIPTNLDAAIGALCAGLGVPKNSYTSYSPRKIRLKYSRTASPNGHVVLKPA